jgi:hypothetical protein
MLHRTRAGNIYIYIYKSTRHLIDPPFLELVWGCGWWLVARYQNFLFFFLLKINVFYVFELF